MTVCPFITEIGESFSVLCDGIISKNIVNESLNRSIEIDSVFYVTFRYPFISSQREVSLPVKVLVIIVVSSAFIGTVRFFIAFIVTGIVTCLFIVGIIVKIETAEIQRNIVIAAFIIYSVGIAYFRQSAVILIAISFSFRQGSTKNAGFLSFVFIIVVFRCILYDKPIGRETDVTVFDSVHKFLIGCIISHILAGPSVVVACAILIQINTYIISVDITSFFFLSGFISDSQIF